MPGAVIETALSGLEAAVQKPLHYPGLVPRCSLALQCLPCQIPEGNLEPGQVCYVGTKFNPFIAKGRLAQSF